MNSTRRAVTHPDLAEVLQARLRGKRDAEAAAADERRRVEGLEAHIIELEAAVARAEALGEQRQHEAETAVKRVRALEVHIATLEAALANAETMGKQRQHEAVTVANRIDELVAEVFKVTSELVETSKRMAEQTAVADKARAELDDYRSRAWWWEHGVG
jgi:chromosome segregation ATPase